MFKAPEGRKGKHKERARDGERKEGERERDRVTRQRDRETRELCESLQQRRDKHEQRLVINVMETERICVFCVCL